MTFLRKGRLGLTLKSTEQRMKILILLAGGVILTALVAFSAYREITDPGFCALCHEMRPEYVTWRASVHNNFNCTDCHLEKSLKKNIVNVAARLYKHFTGTYNQPIEVASETKNQICLQCHSSNRTVSPPGELDFPHKKHVAKGFKCIECHTGAAHGNIMEKGYTTQTDYDKWTVGMGRVYMQQKFTITPMDQCISCHQDNDVLTTCATCHTGIGIPEDHRDNWLEKHGAKAKADIWYCDKCHSYSNNWVRFSESKTEYADYARNNKFCSKCHVGMEGVARDFPSRSSKSKNASVRGSKATVSKPLAEAPPSHNDTWRQTHGTVAAQDKEGCLVCHDENKNTKANSTTTYCVQCHKQAHSPGKHHPIKFTPGVDKLNTTCFRCHSQKSCNKCHAVK